MSEQGQSRSCTRKCWLFSAALGVLTAVLLLALGHYSFVAAILLGALVCLIAGAFLVWMYCGETPVSQASTPVQTATAAPAAAPVAPAPAPEAAPEAAAPAVKPSTELKGEQELAERKGEWTYEADSAEPEAKAPAQNDSVIKPSTELPGQKELAERKGEWRYESRTDDAAPEAAPAPAPAAEAEAPAAVIKPSTALPGQEELAAKKGTWRYEGGDAEAGEGTKPEGLSAPRDGGADDLKKIKGIGPKLEQLCNDLGYYHFDQIASWTPDEVAWVDQNLKGFKGRVTRDNWLEQAKLLASGGETEFSKRVDTGAVY